MVRPQMAPIEPVESVDPQVAYAIEIGYRVSGFCTHGQAHGRCSGVGHEVQPAPAANRIDERYLELVRRVIGDHLTEPRRNDQQRLVGVDRKCLDGERGVVVPRRRVRWRTSPSRPGSP